MTSKKSKKHNLHELKIVVPKEGDTNKRFSEIADYPSVQAAITVKKYGIDQTFQETDISSLVKTLQEQIEATKSNDLSDLEAMLTGQAYVLNAMFNNLTQKAVNNMKYDMRVAEAFLKYVLRAQSQCQNTFEKISQIKNPPLVGYARQANIAHGHQQVNNGLKNQNVKSELLEEKDGKRLDRGTTSKAGRDDPQMETVGEIDRAKD